MPNAQPREPMTENCIGAVAQWRAWFFDRGFGSLKSQ
jgi:hypothetical protein